MLSHVRPLDRPSFCLVVIDLVQINERTLIYSCWLYSRRKSRGILCRGYRYLCPVEACKRLLLVEVTERRPVMFRGCYRRMCAHGCIYAPMSYTRFCCVLPGFGRVRLNGMAKMAATGCFIDIMHGVNLNIDSVVHTTAKTRMVNVLYR